MAGYPNECQNCGDIFCFGECTAINIDDCDEADVDERQENNDFAHDDDFHYYDETLYPDSDYIVE